MTLFRLTDLLTERQQINRAYHEFFRKPGFSLGVYVLPAGGVDRQKPHDEDEVYVVTGGKGVINIAGEDQPVQAGDVIFIEAKKEHFFHIIEEDLELLVLFTPPEGANQMNQF